MAYFLDPSLSAHSKNTQLMNHSTNSNVIIGSKLALAMSVAIGSPVRRPLGTVSNRKSVEFREMDRRCEELKIRSLKLLDGLKAEDARIALNATSMRRSASREATKRIGKVVRKMMEQQASLHSTMEKLLDAMMQQIGGDKTPKLPLSALPFSQYNNSLEKSDTPSSFHF